MLKSPKPQAKKNSKDKDKDKDHTEPQPDSPEVTPVDSVDEQPDQTDAEHQNHVQSSADNSSTAELAQTIAELTADLQRTRADFENFRKQTELQKAHAMNIAKLNTVIKILPLIDDFERAITTYPEQLAPLQKNFDKILHDLNLIKIDTTAGTPFNPDLHEAIAVEGDGDTETIAETLRPGYTYDGSVIRAAMVKVQNT